MSEIYDPTKNKFLLLREGVVRTPNTDIVICLLDTYFGIKNHTAYVTSIKRTPEKQLEIIRQAARARGLDKRYPLAMTCAVDEKDSNGNYVWQMMWSHLLNLDYIVNPPIAAEVLMDYFDRRTGVNKKGRIIPPSVHFYGNAFDIGGRGGDNPTVKDEEEVMKFARESDKILDKMIVDIKIEHGNNAIHCQVKQLDDIVNILKEKNKA